jgi:hypothetical protein
MRLATLLLLASACAAFAQAPLPPGKDGYAYPPGGAAGTTVDVRLGGTEWTPDAQFFVHDPRVKLTVTSKPGPVRMHEPPYWFGIQSYANDPWLPREVTATFAIPKDMPPGPVRWSVANANGGGPGGVFVVGTGPEVMEEENRREPQALPPLPVTVNGRLGRIEEVDRYTFQIAKAGPVTCELTARQLGGDFHGVIEIRDAAGQLLADVADTEGRDPVLTFAAEKDRTYTICVRDIDHRGYRNFTYRLALRAGPRVVTAVPAAGKRGETRAVEFVGVGIATGQAKLETVTKEVAFPNDPARDSFAYTLETPFGTAQPFPLLLDDETDGKFALPGAVTGRIAVRGERIRHTFTGKKGEAWEFAVHDRRIGSPLDVTLSVVGPDGKPVLGTDDTTGHADVRLPFTVPADGEYKLALADGSGRHPALDSVYRLVATKPRPDFQLRTTGIVNVPVGGKAALTVTVVREGGFQEPITLAFTGLPAGVTAPKELVIPAAANTFPVSLECAKDAPASASLVTITGVAKVGQAMVTRAVFGDLKTDLAPRTPDANRTPRVLIATTMKPPFKVTAAEADGGRRIPRGSTHLTPILIERTDGFAGEIVLDMSAAQQRHRQGIRGPALPVPPGVAKIDYPVFLPEWLETTRTSRIGLTAMAQVKDAKGTPRWVQAAMVGQITMSIEGALMKVSHDADELTAVAGEPFDLPLRLARSPKFAEAVIVELIAPDELKGVVTAKTLQLPPDTSDAALTVETKADKRLTGTRTLTVRATGKRDGRLVVSETTVEVEFVGKPNR